MGNKRKYSHYGCKNCKERSIKCDESRPICERCKKKRLKCAYTSNIFLYKPDYNIYKPTATIKQSKPTSGAHGTKTKSQESAQEDIELSIRLHQNFFLSSYYSQSLISQQDNGFIQETTREDEYDIIPDFIKYWIEEYNADLFRHMHQRVMGDKSKPFTGYFDHHDPDIQLYLYLTFTSSKSVYNYPLVIDDDNNHLSKWFLYFSTKFPIMGYILNTVTANLIMVKYNDERWDKIRMETTQICLTIISQRIGASIPFDEMACYMLCVMFLFSERSAAKSDTWRIHLKGAFRLLQDCDLKLNEFVTSNDNKSHIQMVLQMYSFAKNWFIAAETCASLSAPNGGSINSLLCVRKYLAYQPEDKENGVLFNGLNLIKGHSQDLTTVFVELISTSIELRERDIVLSGSAGILQNLDLEPFYIDKANELLKVIAEVERKEVDLFEIADHRKRAIMRACNICYCKALRIFISAALLDKPIYGRHIQESVHCIAESTLVFYDIKHQGLCIHWPIFIAGLCSPPGLQRQYFENVLQDIISNGTFVARNTLERLNNAWMCIDKGDVINEEDYDCITF